jgi:hypothetical protein
MVNPARFSSKPVIAKSNTKSAVCESGNQQEYFIPAFEDDPRFFSAS